MSRARRNGDGVSVKARKSWVTSAGHADVYVTTTGNADTEGSVDVYAFPAGTPGLAVAGQFHGLGLRGNASCPMTLRGAQRLHATWSGTPGGGFDILLGTVMPWFNLGNAAVSVGLCQAVTDAAVRHTSAAKLEHLDKSLSALPTIRAQLAKMSIDLATTRAYLDQTAARIAEPAGRHRPARARREGRLRTTRRCASPTRPCACAVAPPSPSTSRSTATSATPGPVT